MTNRRNRIFRVGLTMARMADHPEYFVANVKFLNARACFGHNTGHIPTQNNRSIVAENMMVLAVLPKEGIGRVDAYRFDVNQYFIDTRLGQRKLDKLKVLNPTNVSQNYGFHIVLFGIKVPL